MFVKILMSNIIDTLLVICWCMERQKMSLYFLTKWSRNIQISTQLGWAVWYAYILRCIVLQWNLSVTTTSIMQIKICAEYRDMLPRPRLVCQEPGLRPIGRSPGVPDKSSRGLGSMSRYSAQILICFIAYIFLKKISFLCGFGWELCRTASMHSALCHCPL